MKTLPIALFPALLAASALAQSPSGLTGGQLVLYSPALNGISSTGGGIALVDPLTGAGTKVYSFWQTAQASDGICYDPVRDRLLFGAAFNSGDPLEFWAGDAAGNVQSLGGQGVTRNCYAAAGDGRVFYRANTGATPNAIRWIDAADQEHLLLDASGSAVWQAATANWFGQLEYSPEHNALLLASGSNFGACGGQQVSVQRLDLSTDGARIVHTTCASITVDASGNCRPVGLAPIDDESFLLTVDSNSSAEQPRLLRVTAEPLGLSVFSNTGSYFAAAATNAGTFSHSRGAAVILDTGNDLLRAFSAGAGGEGVTFGPVGVWSPPGSSGEQATLIEVAPAGAGQGLTTSGSPSISLALGGGQTWTIDAGAGFAGRPYLVLGSASGFAPGFALDGTPVPLNPDAYTSFTVGSANTGPLVATFGLLDGTGAAIAGLQLPAASTPSLAGLVLHHAAVVYGPIFSIDLATNPVAVSLVP